MVWNSGSGWRVAGASIDAIDKVDRHATARAKSTNHAKRLPRF